MKSIHDLLSMRDLQTIVLVNNSETDQAFSARPEVFDPHKLAMIQEALREGFYPMDLSKMDLCLGLLV
jgi:hypothetical protein